MFTKFINELTTSMYIWNLKGLIQARILRRVRKLKQNKNWQKIVRDG